jgi:rare lipoprotein A
MRRYFVFVVFAIAAFTAHADGLSSDKSSFAQVGRATYYHKSLHGFRTANGERFDTQAMTAAHRRLKFNTYVRVTNLRNQRSVIVRINDRLPPRSRAIIDLTHRAARQLGMFHRGVSKVKLDIVDKAELAETKDSN